MMRNNPDQQALEAALLSQQGGGGQEMPPVIDEEANALPQALPEGIPGEEGQIPGAGPSANSLPNVDQIIQLLDQKIQEIIAAGGDPSEAIQMKDRVMSLLGGAPEEGPQLPPEGVPV